MIQKLKNLKMATKLKIGYSIMLSLIIIVNMNGYAALKGIIGQEDPQAYINKYVNIMVVEFVIAVTITLLICAYYSKLFGSEMGRLIKAAGDISIGKMDENLTKTADDEFGQLIEVFQKVIDTTRYQAKIVQAVSEGDLTVEVTPSSEHDLLGISLKQLVEKNHHALSSIFEAADQVTIGSSQVASASDALAEGSSEQASATELITSSIADVAGKTKVNAEEANTAAKLMETAMQNIAKGNEAMHDMLIAMDDINKSSDSISKIIKVIDDIAFQTNILALNAAVEAARAGEAGKGFGVVAEEVRNLAAKSAAAAAETSEMIEGSVRKVAAGAKIANETEQAFERITADVKSSVDIVNEIATSSNYQATAITQIDQAIDQVAQVVQTNSATSEECAAASEELAGQARFMHEMLAFYTLNKK